MSVPLRRLQQAPRHLLVCEKGNARHARSRHAVHVRDHAYNCRVSAGWRRCPDGDRGASGSRPGAVWEEGAARGADVSFRSALGFSVSVSLPFQP